MSATDLIAILPLLMLAATAVLLLLGIAIRRNATASFSTAAAGLILACASLAPAARHLAPVTPLFTIDGYALFYQGLILISALTVCLLSHGYLDARRLARREEYYLLLVLATLGATALVASAHYASFFLGLETLSLSLVALISYVRGQERPLEAGIKYLILSGVSSAFLLFGVAVLYAGFGTLAFSALAHASSPGAALPEPSLLAGIALVLVGIGFKLSVVPFHMWAPDIYEGAPAPVTAFVAVVSKCAVFALLLRFFTATGSFQALPLTVVLGGIAVMSMLAGNLLALRQRNVKRLLAYSSIAHLGYALVAFLVGGPFAIEAVSVYLVAYAITTLGAFGVITLLPSPDGARDADLLEEYRGLFRASPGLSLAFAAALLSLAGIPLTIGFIAKFYAVASGVDGRHPVLLGTLVAGSILGLYYYLRVIVAMTAPAATAGSLRGAGVQDRAPGSGTGKAIPAPGAAAPRPAARQGGNPVNALGHAVLAALVLLLIGLGAYPAPLLTLIRATASMVAR